uniref:No apical meristem-associated C-terminal domain-containing protein n=1 Tax=Brassica oleracea TaxID=3712 RepID=A0A3P6FVL7_BRAOL|nr:unnamed protein product [Brassica oleracea]
MRLLVPYPLSPLSPMSPLSPRSSLSPLSLTSKMDFNPFQDSANFVGLLHSQQNVVFGSQGRVSLSLSQVPSLGTQAVELPAEWNDQKSTTFWTRVAAYFSASPKLAGCEKREGTQCKQRWHKMNEVICKFSGAYEASTREKTSGMNDNDILKLTHKIFSNNQQKKFSLEHTWNELRNNQKWCELATAKTESSSKKRKFADGSLSGSSSQVNENDAGIEGTSRPPGVKAAKARGKKPQVEGQDVYDYQLMWSIKKDDLAMKQQLSKMRLLEKLVAKKNLADYEEDLKKKLINELM